MIKRFCQWMSGLLLLTILLFPSPVSAGSKEIISDGTYIMGAGETPSVALAKAVFDAKYKAADQMGTYLANLPEVKNMQLTPDELNTFAWGQIKTTVLDEKQSKADNNTLEFRVSVRCVVSTNDIHTNDKQQLRTLTVIRDTYDKLIQESTLLRQQSSTYTKQQFKNKMMQNEQFFIALQLFEKGYDAHIHSDYRSAISFYSKALKRYPLFEYPYRNRGCAYMSIGKFDLALADFNQAVEINPQFADAYYNRALVYQNNGQYELALENYNLAIQYNPQDSQTYNNRGILYQSHKQHELALADFNQAIEINPQDAYAYCNRGLVYKVTGRNDLAVESYSQAIHFDPQCIEAYYNRAIAHQDSGQYDLALADYNQIIKLDLRYANAYYSKAFVYRHLGRYIEAIQAYKLFLEYAPSDDSDIPNVKQLIRELGGTV